MTNRVIIVSLILIVFIFSFSKLISAEEGGNEKQGTITVPSEDCPTIKKALESANPGDIIYVKPGSYNEGGDLRFKNGVKLYGAGADKTGIALDRLTLCSQSGIEGSLSDIAIEGFNINIKSGPVYINLAKNITIKKCIITGNGGGVYILRSDNIEIINCTIANLREGITVGYVPVKLSIRNSIISNCGRIGILISPQKERKQIDYRTGRVIEPKMMDGEKIKLSLYYNDIWGHSYNYYDMTVDPNSSNIPGENNISKDAKFVDAAKGDYCLRSDSPCIHAGDPDPKYNNPDGTRNDIGAFPAEKK